MKIQLIDARPGVMKSIVLKEWMRVVLSICLLGLPVILGYFSIQIADARNTEIAKGSPAPALASEFDFSQPAGMAHDKTHNTSQALALQATEGVPRRSAKIPSTDAPSEVSGASDHAQPAQLSQSSAEYSALMAFLNYGDLLTSGQLLPSAANPSSSELFRGFTLHKNGRLIDTASYLRRTVR